MREPVRLTGEDIRDLIQRFAALDLGEWNRGDVEQTLSGLGWPIVGEENGAIYVATGLPTGDGIVVPDLIFEGLHGEYHMLGVSLALHPDRAALVEAFRDAWRLAEEALGPAPVRGGPGPWLRWPRPQGTLRLRVSRFGVDLELASTQWLENEEYQSGTYGERAELPFLWCGVRQLEGMYLPQTYLAPDWGALETWLAESLGCLVDDVPVFGDALVTLLGVDQNRFVQASIGATLHVEASALGGQAGRAMTELGWLPPAPNWWRTFDAPIADDAKVAAHMLVETLRLFQVELPSLRCSSWTDQTDRLALPGIGVA